MTSQHPPFYTVNGQVSQSSPKGERSFSLYFHLDLYSPYNLPNTDEYICWQEMPPQKWLNSYEPLHR